MPVLGVDITDIATAAGMADATQTLGAVPAFVGRYFKNPQNPDFCQYQPERETTFLHSIGAKMLCIGRQTGRIAGTEKEGYADGVWNMAAIIEALGLDYLHHLGLAPLVFLDTEPQTTLSADYYLGWSAALRDGEFVPEPKPSFSVRFTPGVYINRGDTPAWNNLRASIAGGAVCHGAWVAHYLENPAPTAWNLAQASPQGTQAPCPILGWQYFGDYKTIFDFTILEPSQAQATIALLPSVPAPRVALQV